MIADRVHACLPTADKIRRHPPRARHRRHPGRDPGEKGAALTGAARSEYRLRNQIERFFTKELAPDSRTLRQEQSSYLCFVDLPSAAPAAHLFTKL